MSGSLFEQYKAALRRGHVAALAGQLDDALEAYQVAARLVPERALPHASQGTVLHRLDRWPEAAAAFDHALQLAPDDEAALRARATAREERGLRSGAAADFERLAFVLDIAGRSADSANSARRAAQLEPTPSREALVARLSAAAGGPASSLEPASAEQDRRADGEPDEQIAIDADARPDAAPAGAVAPEAGSADLIEAASEPVDAIDLDPDEVMSPASAALAARIAELGTQPVWVDLGDHQVGTAGADDGEGGAWPRVDLPSPPPPPIEGPPPDPEELFAEAAQHIASGDHAAARDRMLLAAIVHRTAGRIDAAMEVCLQLLAMAPGDAQVHLAIANLQLDRGWNDVATEKIELLLRLTSLTGDTQGEADAHGLAAERLRDDALGRPSTG